MGREYGGGECPPHHPTKGAWGSVVTCELPRAFRGGTPAEKWILCMFEVRKKPSGTPVSVF